MSSPSAAAPASGGVDYDFDCPQYRDFLQADDQTRDQWFGDSKVEDSNEQFHNTSTLTAPISSLDISAVTVINSAAPAIASSASASPAAAAAAADAEQPLLDVSASASAASPNVSVAEVAASLAVNSSILSDIGAASGNVSRNSILGDIQASGIALADDEQLDAIAPNVSTFSEDGSSGLAGNSPSIGHAVFASGSHRSSLPMMSSLGPLGTMVAPLLPSSVSSVPLSDSARSAHLRQSLLHEAQESHVAVDEEVNALQASLLGEEEKGLRLNQASNSPMVFQNLSAPIDAQEDGEQKEDAEEGEDVPLDESIAPADESIAAPVQSLADAFAAVADEAVAAFPSKKSARRLAKQPATQRGAPSTGRRTTATSAAASMAPSAATSRRTTMAPGDESSLPGYLRPTAAANARRAQVEEEVAKHAVEATGRRPAMHIPTAASAAKELLLANASTATTPRKVADKSSKKRSASKAALDRLSRPTTAAKPRREEIAAAAAAAKAPNTARKAAPSAAGAPAKLTVGHSPALSTRSRAQVRGAPTMLTSEEEEVRRIAAEREEVAREIKRNMALHDSLLSKAAPLPTEAPVRSAAPLTTPAEFNFRTAKRAKTDAACAAASSPPAAPASARKVDEHGHLFVTKPLPFTFHTASRLREVAPVLSREEAELAEIAAMKPFKALPLREDILTSGGQLGVPRIQKVKTTEAHSPELATKERHMKRKQEEAEAGEVAPSVTAAAAAGAQGAEPKSASKRPRTAGAPRLATEERGARKADELKVRLEAEQTRATQASHFVARPLHMVSNPLPAAPVAPAAAGGAMAAEPHCVAASKEAKARFEAKVAADEAAARAARAFKARPNPFLGGAALAAASSSEKDGAAQAVKSDRPLTVAMTPALASVDRAARRAAWAAEQEAKDALIAAQAEQAARESAEIAAREVAELRRSMKPATLPLNPHILKEASVPPKPQAPRLTQPESPMLVTKRRAKSRAPRMELSLEEVGEENAPGNVSILSAADGEVVKHAHVEQIQALLPAPEAEPIMA